MKTTTRQMLIGGFVGVALTAVVGLLGLGPKAVTGSGPLSVQSIAASANDPNLPLAANSSVSDVLALMLKSHTTWTSLQASSKTTNAPGSSEEVVSTEQVVFDSDGRGYAEMQFGTVQSLVFVVNGTTASIEDRTRQKYTQLAIPNPMKDLASGPPAPPANGEKFVIPHPLARLIAGDATSYIFSTGLAQAMQGEVVNTTGVSHVAGREAVSLEWKLYREGETNPYELRRLWVDAETGVVLKAQAASAETDFAKITDEFEINYIDYGSVISEDQFVFRPAPDSQFIGLSEFY